MNNTYRALLLIIILNIISIAMISNSTEPFDNTNANNLSMEGLDEDTFIVNSDLQKEYINANENSQSKIRNIIKIFAGVHVPNEEDDYSGFERIIILIIGYFYIFINMMAGILIYKTIRGSQ